MKIIKRDGSIVGFNKCKIENAILKAMKYGSGIYEENVAKDIAEEIEQEFYKENPTVKRVEDMVYDKLIEHKHELTAKAYEGYRAVQSFKREVNTSDDSILGLINRTNEEVMNENSNKNADLASTQRDLIAGEISKDIARRKLIPTHIVQAHDEGVLHYHDMDYAIQPIHNCNLINLEDMLQNGTVINGKMVEPPKSFGTACTVTTQIIAQIASGQYGGNSITIKHIAPFLRVTYNKYYDKYYNKGFSMSMSESLADDRMMEELKSGIQTIRYQLSTLHTSNGQSPFSTIYLEIEEGHEYEHEMALICEEMIRQRIEGMKSYKGQNIGEEFPKLVYLLDEHNCLEGGKYDYITKLCAICNAKRLVPDYQSAKLMRKNYEGNTFPPMGCVDGEEIITYKIKDKLFVESFKRMWERLSKTHEIKEQNSKGNFYIDTKNVKIFDSSKNGFVKVTRLIKNKDKSDWNRIKFTNGRTLLATSDHPLPLIGKGRTFVQDLKTGDSIYITQNQYCEENKLCDDDMSWMLGFILCDGCYDKQFSVSIAATGEDDIENRYKKCIQKYYNLNPETILWERGKRGYYKEIRVRKNYQDIISEFKEIFGGLQKINRHIPNEVFTYNRDAKLSFLAGMIDADGYINNKRKNRSVVQIGSTNKELSFQTMALAQSLGYSAKVYLNHYTSKDLNKIRYRVEFNAEKELIEKMACEKKKSKLIEGEEYQHTNTAKVKSIEFIGFMDKYSYDVTTESDKFDVSGILSHNCRSHLSPWKDENGNYKWYGRFNQGVISLNLVQVALTANKDMDKFWEILDKRLELCFEALMVRHNLLKGTKSDVSPIHWQHGGVARLKKGEVIDSLLENGYSTLSLGYVGVYEMTQAMLGVSHTTKKGEQFALKVMQHLKNKCDEWKKETGLGFGLYGTPGENLTSRFCRIDKQKFGEIPNVTDRKYYTNSYHVHVAEPIDAFSKLKFESQFHDISSGGCISYIEVPNMQKNIKAIEQIINYIYHNVQYAEINTKADVCYKCGFTGEIVIKDGKTWTCPQCGNQDIKDMQVLRRTCGYIGSNEWSEGRTAEIAERVLHL